MSNLLSDALANPIVGTVGTVIAVGAVALWVTATWWTWRDASRRSESSLAAFVAAGWIIVSTPLLLPLSLAVYRVARPQVTAAEQRVESLIAALAATTAADTSCPGCATRIDAGWVRCPQCTTWLAAPCASCGEWSPAGLELCPFCGHEGHAAPSVAGAPSAAAAADLTRRERAPRMAAPVARQSGA